MSTDEQLVTESLRRLAEHAPTFTPDLARAERRRGAILVPLLAAAAVLVLVVVGVTLNGGSGPDPVPAPTPTVPDSTPSTTVRLDGALYWSHQRETGCLPWDPPPPGVDTILRVDALDMECVSKARRDATTVMFAPWDTSASFVESWGAGATTPWRTVAGADVSRLTAGPLAEMSSRHVDGLTCAECNQVVLVMGPDPAKVRRLVESVEEGSQFRPDPEVVLGCMDGMTFSDLGWIHQNGATPREAAEILLETKAPGAEVLTWPDDQPYAVVVPHDSRGDRTMIVVVRNESGHWDADQIYRCSD